MNHFIHQHHLHIRGKNKELNEMYLSMILKTFGISVVSIFIPIYLYSLGYSLRLIFLYYLIVSVFQFSGDLLVGKAIARFGPKHIIMCSYPLLAIHLLLLATLGTYHWPLWLVSLFAALSLSLFWAPYHNDFSKAKDKKKTGKEVSALFILMQIVGAFGPIVGGVIAEKFGLQYGIFIAVIIILAAAVPLLKKKEIVAKRPFYFRNLSLKENYRDMIAYGGLNIEISATAVIWPLFLFFIIRDYARIGSIASVSILATIALSIFIGRLTDKYKKREVLRVSGVANFFTSIMKIMVGSLSMAYIVGAISSLSNIFIIIPFVSKYYLHADRKPRTEYIVMMEMAVDVARGLFFLSLYLATFFADTKTIIIFGFVLGALGALLTMLMTNPRNEEKVIKVQKEIEKVKI